MHNTQSGRSRPFPLYTSYLPDLIFMPNRYAPVPNPRSEFPVRDEMEHEMKAAFDYSEGEEELDDNNESESRPLNPVHTSPSQSTAGSGMYDFENLDYDHPPPGSPPRPSSTALPNEHGNTNGLIPSFNSIPRPSPPQNWLQRTAAQALPSSLTDRLGLRRARPAGAIGGGVQNDGVFANVTAKPSMPVRVQEGDETYIIPEDARDEAPPSYAAAQADAVPPYWDTTVHAPFAPDAMGEIIIDSLPTGSLFSFLWNMLISVSFQFVGFLLTYLLHTSHAARFGSRAGLGVTLIQYGFALRSRLDNEGETATWKLWKHQRPAPTGTSYNSTLSNTASVSPQTSSMFAEATTEWLSFFLMTIGWFILLTSVLGFWRVKRWERGILASQRENSQPTESTRRESPLFNLAVPLSSVFQRISGRRSRDGEQADEQATALSRAEEGVANHHDDARETDVMLSGADANSPANDRQVEVTAADRRLRDALQSAGFM